ncbi:MAG: hypothetical protein QOG10_4496 [Kribbellaceae bacterium]|jgi:hypothetical protein|nr:hypothetical protein [Kribbellaceae bacterium]
MTRLYLATHGDQRVWVVALIDLDVWTYVGNTGMFHLNQQLRDDFFVGADFTYTEIGTREALQYIEDGVGQFDEEELGYTLRAWEADHETLPRETVFASAVADHS